MVVMLLLLNPAATQVWVARRICVPIKLGTTHSVGVGVGVAVGVTVGAGVAVGVAAAVAVGVGDAAPTDCLSWKASCWELPRMATRPSTHAWRCWLGEELA